MTTREGWGMKAEQHPAIFTVDGIQYRRPEEAVEQYVRPLFQLIDDTRRIGTAAWRWIPEEITEARLGLWVTTGWFGP